MRQIVLDTETTGLDPETGHRIIEIGAVELIDRRFTGNNYHQYIQPERDIDEEALRVHGITPEFLADKPVFSEVAAEFLEYIKGAQLVIHNAPFDVGFIDHEFMWLDAGYPKVDEICTVLDTLVLARKMHPGGRLSLDALCSRYSIDNSQRVLHGALLDAEILADLYLTMTGGQTRLSLGGESEDGTLGAETLRRVAAGRAPLPVLRATDEELAAHEERLQHIDNVAGEALWRKLH